MSCQPTPCQGRSLPDLEAAGPLLHIITSLSLSSESRGAENSPLLSFPGEQSCCPSFLCLFFDRLLVSRRRRMLLRRQLHPFWMSWRPTSCTSPSLLDIRSPSLTSSPSAFCSLPMPRSGLAHPPALLSRIMVMSSILQPAYAKVRPGTPSCAVEPYHGDVQYSADGLCPGSGLAHPRARLSCTAATSSMLQPVCCSVELNQPPTCRVTTTCPPKPGKYTCGQRAPLKSSGGWKRKAEKTLGTRRPSCKITERHNTCLPELQETQQNMSLSCQLEVCLNLICLRRVCSFCKRACCLGDIPR